MVRLDHVAIIFEPDGINEPTVIAKGAKTKRFYGLNDDQEYAFLVYGVDTNKNNQVIPDVRLSTPTPILPMVVQR